MTLPIIFLSHGAGPAFLLDCTGGSFKDADRSSSGASFVRRLQTFLPSPETHPIKSILVISAHWEEASFTVDYQTGETKLLYDYYGFPTEGYPPFLTYPARTNLELAVKVEFLLKASNLDCKQKDRGFDHGVFIPLKLAFPDADIPVVQLSLKSDLDPSEHVRLGEALFPLRSEGVLIICSGQITHNDRRSRRPGIDGSADPQCVAFTDWVNHLLCKANSGQTSDIEAVRNSLINIQHVAPEYSYCHPRTEHFLPLHVAFGAAFPAINTSANFDCSEKECANDNNNTEFKSVLVKRIFHDFVMGGMGLDSYIFY